jgi:hypothetical protein
MRIEKGVLVALGYGKHIRSDRVVALEPIEEGRGPGQRTNVYLEDFDEPLIASRSEVSIMRDLTQTPREVSKAREQYELLSDIVETIGEINPLLRSIIRDQGKWDLDRLEERIKETLADDEMPGERTARSNKSFEDSIA